MQTREYASKHCHLRNSKLTQLWSPMVRLPSPAWHCSMLSPGWALLEAVEKAVRGVASGTPQHGGAPAGSGGGSIPRCKFTGKCPRGQACCAPRRMQTHHPSAEQKELTKSTENSGERMTSSIEKGQFSTESLQFVPSRLWSGHGIHFSRFPRKGITLTFRPPLQQLQNRSEVKQATCSGTSTAARSFHAFLPVTSCRVLQTV